MSERSAPRFATREAFARALLDFVNGPLCARHARSRMPVDQSTLLFDAGVIDSLGIIDLLAFVETGTGRTIPLKMIDMRYFGTVDRITCAFWVEPGQP